MKKKRWILPALVLAALLVVSRLLLGSDTWTFWAWWLLAAVMGLAAMPVTGRLFIRFEDKGWIFSKALAIAVTGYLEWLLVSIHLVSFSSASCALVVIACAILCALLFVRQEKEGIDTLPTHHVDLVLWEEILFFAAFLVWTYLAGFNAAAYGTEKFMDYGFMEAMMRSADLPAKDLWYSQGKINYYYGGQYFAVFLTKLSVSKVALTYNLMRTFVAGFAFAMPFSLVRQMLRDRISLDGKGKTAKGLVPILGGLTGSFAVCFAGNMHYVVYAAVLPLLQKWKGQEVSGYWFPDATRYIGFRPDVPDKTIHEFPCYSFILGDLHAHVVNIMFVLLLMGLLYADFSGTKHRKEAIGPLVSPYLAGAAFLLGLYQINNYWDFIIYFVVVTGSFFFANIIQLRGRWRKIWGRTLLQAAILFAVSQLVAVPFTAQFESMVDGVALAQNHSLPHQLMVLWGLPLILGLVFLLAMIGEGRGLLRKKGLWRLMNILKNPDLFAILMFFCAAGLVLIPELVYVRDIYENGNARANTMFKLTYQAYMLFGMMMGYVIWRMLAVSKGALQKIISVLGLVFLCWTVGYFGNCVHSWYGGLHTPDQRPGLDATAFLANDFPEDQNAIYWLKENVSGSPVTLEANGDSYTGYGRISAMTGLPTILGWYVHEWLWRSNPEDLNEKSADVEAIYTSDNRELIDHLLKLYDVEYIVVGSKEREKYESRLQEDQIRSLGTVVYDDPASSTFIVQVS